MAPALTGSSPVPPLLSTSDSQQSFLSYKQIAAGVQSASNLHQFHSSARFDVPDESAQVSAGTGNSVLLLPPELRLSFMSFDIGNKKSQDEDDRRVSAMKLATKQAEAREQDASFLLGRGNPSASQDLEARMRTVRQAANMDSRVRRVQDEVASALATLRPAGGVIQGFCPQKPLPFSNGAMLRPSDMRQTSVTHLRSPRPPLPRPSAPGVAITGFTSPGRPSALPHASARSASSTSVPIMAMPKPAAGTPHPVARFQTYSHAPQMPPALANAAASSGGSMSLGRMSSLPVVMPPPSASPALPFRSSSEQVLANPAATSGSLVLPVATGFAEVPTVPVSSGSFKVPPMGGSMQLPAGNVTVLTTGSASGSLKMPPMGGSMQLPAGNVTVLTSGSANVPVPPVSLTAPGGSVQLPQGTAGSLSVPPPGGSMLLPAGNIAVLNCSSGSMSVPVAATIPVLNGSAGSMLVPAGNVPMLNNPAGNSVHVPAPVMNSPAASLHAPTAPGHLTPRLSSSASVPSVRLSAPSPVPTCRQVSASPVPMSRQVSCSPISISRQISVAPAPSARVAFPSPGREYVNASPALSGVSRRASSPLAATSPSTTFSSLPLPAVREFAVAPSSTGAVIRSLPGAVPNRSIPLQLRTSRGVDASSPIKQHAARLSSAPVNAQHASMMSSYRPFPPRDGNRSSSANVIERSDSIDLRRGPTETAASAWADVFSSHLR
mmetsp:Transcript_51548/g.81805  ORF Transcript_51548/g.81805 Transcript_51548/m.81805 type:complete len:720 (-) Transcript_51548:70-2229(-)